MQLPGNSTPCPILGQYTDYMVNKETETKNILTDIFLWSFSTILNKLLVIDGHVICVIQVEDTGHILGIKYYRTFLQIIKIPI